MQTRESLDVIYRFIRTMQSTVRRRALPELKVKNICANNWRNISPKMDNGMPHTIATAHRTVKATCGHDVWPKDGQRQIKINW